MSVVERIWDRLAFDSAVGAAQLVYKRICVPIAWKLRELIAWRPAFEALLKNIDLIRQFQAEGMAHGLAG